MPTIDDDEFWDEEEAALWDGLAKVVIDVLLEGVESGASLLPADARVLVDFDFVNTSVVNYARTYRYELIKEITDTTRKQVQTLVSDWVGSGAPLGVLETQLTPLFGENRAASIAATETTRVYAEGNREALESTGMVDEVVWNTAQDDMVCVVCGELDGAHIGVEDIDAFPPAHPSCRCWVTPIVSEQAFENALDEVFS